MPDKDKKRTGISGFTVKVLNEAGTAVVDLYNLGADTVDGIFTFSRKKTSKLSRKSKRTSKKNADSLYPGKAKIIKDRIKIKAKIKEIYQEIGKEKVKSKNTDGGKSVDPHISENITKLTSDIKEFEDQITQLEQKSIRLKKEKIEVKEKKTEIKKKKTEVKKKKTEVKKKKTEVKKKKTEVKKKKKQAQEQATIRKKETRGLPVEVAVKAAIASSLKSGKFDSRSEKSKFEKVANDLLSEENEVRILAANELAKMKNEAAVPVLTESVKKGDSNLTSEIINALITIGSVNSVPLFKEMVTDKNYRVRVACLRGLYKLAEEDDDAVQLLVDAVKDEHPEVRKYAITFIGWKDNAKSVPSLVNALRDDHNDVKKTALDALATIRDKATVLPVIRSLGDKDEIIREKALDTLKMITGEQVSFDMTSSGNDRANAVETLIEWWRKKRTGEEELFVPEINEIADDPKPDTAGTGKAL